MKCDNRRDKSMIFSILSLIAAAAVIVGITLINAWGASGDELPAFVGDEPWYAESRTGCKNILGKIYVPVSIFQKFGYEIRTSTKSVTIVSPSGSKYISFSTVNDNEKAYTPERKEFYLRSFWLSHGVLGVPVSDVCEYFGLNFEMYPTTSKNESDAKAIRISAGKSKYTITDLLRIYNPSLLPAPATTAETTSPAVQPARAYLIYLTFEDAPNEYTGEILDLLDEYGYRATFFLNGDALVANADTVRRIIAGGHSIGLHTMTRDSRFFARDIANFIGELREENALLYKLFRITSRLVRAPDGSRTRSFVINAEESKLIESLGYVIWDFNVDTYDAAGYSPSRVADNAISGIVAYEVPVLRFHSTDTTVKALPAVLEYIKLHSDQFSVAVITPAADNLSFAG